MSGNQSFVTTIALTDLLVGLLEFRDPFFRGGSSLTGLVAVTIGREIGLEGERLQELALAALLRDLGRLALGGELLARGTSQPDSQERASIERHVKVGLDLLDGVGLPSRVMKAIEHHHERWDGEGYPDGLAGDAIPLEARVLAVADSFAAMIRPRPYRPPLNVQAATDEMRNDAGTVYDASIVKVLLELLERPDRPIFGTSPGHHVLILHADGARAMVIAAWLCQHGFFAEAAPDLDAALDRIRRVPVAALVLDAGDENTDAAERIEWLVKLRASPRAVQLPAIFVDTPTDDRRTALLKAGAEVCLPENAGMGKLRDALETLIQRADPGWGQSLAEGPGGSVESPWLALRGGLNEFPLPWLLQVLKYDNRTAKIVIDAPDDRGAIFLESGEPRHATTAEATGEDALRKMLRWQEGTFAVRLNSSTEEHTIESKLMQLLLDEAVAMDNEDIFGAVPT